MLTRSQRKFNNSLLGLPAETRVEILKLVLDNDTIPLRLDRPLILGPVHPILHLCRLIREEAEPLFYNSTPICVKNMDDLHDALKHIPDNFKLCSELQLEKLEQRRARVRRGDALAGPKAPSHSFEPGLNLISQMPKLQRLQVDIGAWRELDYDTGEIRLDAERTVICETLPKHPALRTLVIRGRAVNEEPGHAWLEGVAEVLELQEGKWRVARRVQQALDEFDSWNAEERELLRGMEDKQQTP